MTETHAAAAVALAEADQRYRTTHDELLAAIAAYRAVRAPFDSPEELAASAAMLEARRRFDEAFAGWEVAQKAELRASLRATLGLAEPDHQAALDFGGRS